MDKEKLKELEKKVRIGGKGTARRKLKRHVKSADTRKLEIALGKLHPFEVEFEYICMFKDDKDDTVLFFEEPAVQISVKHNVAVIKGTPMEATIDDLIVYRRDKVYDMYLKEKRKAAGTQEHVTWQELARDFQQLSVQQQSSLSTCTTSRTTRRRQRRIESR